MHFDVMHFATALLHVLCLKNFEAGNGSIEDFGENVVVTSCASTKEAAATKHGKHVIPAARFPAIFWGTWCLKSSYRLGDLGEDLGS